MGGGIRCVRCDRTSPEDAKFCANCGAPLAAACAQCGSGLPAAARFCSSCGQAVGARAGPDVRATGAPQAYTPKHLADTILTSRAALEGERKQVAVLFADLANFTQMSERLDPEELHELMNFVFQMILAEVHRYEGTVNQFTGDGIMALFGAPVALQDHALRAVETALAVQTAMAQAAAEFQQRWGQSPSLRIGINTGLVVVGKIGDDLRMDYTAQGDTVNTAARLQALAEPGTVTISEATYREVAHELECEPLGRHHLKGKTEALEVFRPISRKSTPSRTTSLFEAPRTPFVGRVPELAQLREARERARAGSGSVIVVRGEAGIGKSRLVAELRRAPDPGMVGWGEGHAVVSSGLRTPYLPIVALLRTLLGLPDDSRVAGDALGARLEEIGVDAPSVTPLLRHLIGVGPADAGAESMPAPARKRAIFDALTAVIDAASRRTPQVLVIENCQWLDEGSEEFLEFLADRVAACATLVVLTCRPGQRPRLGSAPGIPMLELGALDTAEREQLARAILGEGADRQVLALVVEKTAGNPLFVEEVGRSIVERPESGAPGVLRIPSTVRDLIAARIDRLAERVKSVLTVASVIGREFSAHLLGRVAEDPAGVPEILATLVKVEMIAPTTRETLAFRYPLAQEVAYEGLLIQRRRLLHGRIGRALEEDERGRVVERAEELAHHFLQAEEWERAVGYLREAARKAAALCSNGDAVMLLGRAREALDRLPKGEGRSQLDIDLRLDLRPPLFQLGRLKEVFALSREAEYLAREAGDEARLGRIYTYLVNLHYMQGEPVQTIAYGERCLAIGEATGDVGLQMLARQYIGQSHHARGLYDEAGAVLAHNVTATAPAGLSRVASGGWLGFALAERGEFAQAHLHGAAAQEEGEALGNPYGCAIARTMRALVWLRQGRPEEAAPLLEAALEACRAKRLTVWQPIPSVLLGVTLTERGRVNEALPLLEAGVALTEQLGVRAYLPLWVMHLAEGQLAAGHIERARGLGERALFLARDCKESGHEAWALWLLGEVGVACGTLAQAEASFADAMAIAATRGMRPLLARCHASLGAACRDAGMSARAQRELDAAARLAASIGMTLRPGPVHGTAVTD